MTDRGDPRPLSVTEAIEGRRSIRAFRPEPVPRPMIERVLATAGRAPSGSNIQPWRVYVVTGARKAELEREMLAAFDRGAFGEDEYQYYPKPWREPYLERRRKAGWGLYSLLGITRDDKDGMARQLRRNFLFFDAPVGLIFSIDRDLPMGSWLDYGMFIQSVMLAARGLGLETCPQQAFSAYHAIIRRVLGIPQEEMVVCGMALGYADWSVTVNRLVTEREPLDRFITFV